MTGRRIALVIVLILVAVGLIGGTVWFLRSRSVDGGLPSLVPSRPSGSQANPSTDPKYQAAPDEPPVPAWNEGDPITAPPDEPPPYQPPYTNPAAAPAT